jgi:hypothetical protein
MSGPPRTPEDPVFIAAVKMIERTGVRKFEIRYQDDEQPVVWIAVGTWRIHDGRPVATCGAERYEAAAALDPVNATLRLLDEVLDGGQCQHCGRPTGATEEWRGDMPLADVMCWYRYDPETQSFRRGCE